jgi:hypothetical protein
MQSLPVPGQPTAQLPFHPPQRLSVLKLKITLIIPSFMQTIMAKPAVFNCAVSKSFIPFVNLASLDSRLPYLT